MTAVGRPRGGKRRTRRRSGWPAARRSSRDVVQRQWARQDVAGAVSPAVHEVGRDIQGHGVGDDRTLRSSHGAGRVLDEDRSSSVGSDSRVRHRGEGGRNEHVQRRDRCRMRETVGDSLEPVGDSDPEVRLCTREEIGRGEAQDLLSRVRPSRGSAARKAHPAPRWRRRRRPTRVSSARRRRRSHPAPSQNVPRSPHIPRGNAGRGTTWSRGLRRRPASGPRARPASTRLDRRAAVRRCRRSTPGPGRVHSEAEPSTLPTCAPVSRPRDRRRCLAATDSSTSVSDIPTQRRSTSRVCCPTLGPTRSMLPGVTDRRYSVPGLLRKPRSGCSTNVGKCRWWRLLS